MSQKPYLSLRSQNRAVKVLASTFCLIGFICAALPAVAQSAESVGLTEERAKTIVAALVAKEWKTEAIEADKSALEKRQSADIEQERLWQGNSPRVDLRFRELMVQFKDGLGADARDLNFSLEAGKKFYQAEYSDNVHPWFKGGVSFQEIRQPRVTRIFIPGKGNKGVLLLMPPLKLEEDLYMLMCPRKVGVRNPKLAALQNFPWKADSMRAQVHGHIRARLLSGTGSGSIEASIERTQGIPPAHEVKDSARGRNPQVELLYRTDQTAYPLQPFPESGERSEQLLMTIDMRLPSGNRRTLLEKYNVWAKTVEVPEIELALPYKTVSLTDVLARMTSDFRFLRPQDGIATVMETGRCLLLMGERSETERILSQEQPDEEPAEGQPVR
jgi:hypothetical protein